MCNQGYACTKYLGTDYKTVDKICPQGEYCYNITLTTIASETPKKECGQDETYETNAGKLKINRVKCKSLINNITGTGKSIMGKMRQNICDLRCMNAVPHSHVQFPFDDCYAEIKLFYCKSNGGGENVHPPPDCWPHCE